uniref:Phosphogluconate n=1 Tax=Triatoma infestans TaxID=30076 RepID=A0A170Z6C4_TRIIF
MTENLWLIKFAIVLDKKERVKWTAITALDLGVPVTLIGESVFCEMFIFACEGTS